jgi:hypothetical protein
MELLGCEQEVLKVTLVDVHLPLVHEVQDRHQVTEPGTQIFIFIKEEGVSLDKNKKFSDPSVL